LRRGPLVAPIINIIAGFQDAVIGNLVGLIIIIVIGAQLLGGRRWGDGLAKTVVVWNKHRDKAPFNQFPNPARRQNS
jgi:hypothetical protein